MASPKEFPEFVGAARWLGAPRLRAIASARSIALPPGDDPIGLAAALLAKLKHPSELGPVLADEDLDRIGEGAGLGVRAAWRPSLSAEELARLLPWQQPSYAGDVWARLQKRVAIPRAPVRSEAARDAHAKAWPELATEAAWKGADRAGLTRALASALAMELGEPGHDGFARLVDAKTGVAYVVIVGGSFTMGLAADEKRELNRRAKALGPEALEHAKGIAKQASPTREVAVAPFLLAERLLGGERARALGVETLDEVARLDAEDAAALVARAGRRLASEAEWEYVARAGGSAWLHGDADPVAWIARADAPGGFGLEQLAWGEWVDDGWHDTYKRAPETSDAWEPRARPEMARSGAKALAPWQNPGEQLLLHVTARDRSTGEHGVRLAMDLPARR